MENLTGCFTVAAGAAFFLLSSMNFLYRFVGNYALAIILLSLLLWGVVAAIVSLAFN